jgi:hypothetical protein
MATSTPQMTNAINTTAPETMEYWRHPFPSGSFRNLCDMTKQTAASDPNTNAPATRSHLAKFPQQIS